MTKSLLAIGHMPTMHDEAFDYSDDGHPHRIELLDTAIRDGEEYPQWTCRCGESGLEADDFQAGAAWAEHVMQEAIKAQMRLNPPAIGENQEE